ncbi:MAG: sulfatase-like hydrolase/transferase [Candidatus Latescibacteria bacterium]|nr:sulfatase-like hydrolase/transferase [Candidatus Latescibacterota bacterium]
MSSQPLNILFMFADQMHAFAMGCMGNSEIKTPNLDRLASQGTLFRNCYSNAPVCTPFRASLVTGMYGSQTDTLRNCAYIPPNTRTLAAALNDGGHRTSWVGKWHLGDKGNIGVPPELRADFTDFIGYQCYNDFLHGVKFWDENNTEHVYDRHRTDVTTDIALERLDNVKDHPFALFVSYQNPHYPEQPAWRFDQMYQGTDLTRRPNAQDVEPYTGTQSPPSPKPRENDPLYQRYGNDLDEYLRQYYAMVTQLDDNIGRMLDRLDELDLADNTVVVFTSDHGDMQGSHGLTNKGLPWEESSRIPLIVRVPNGVSGQAVDDLVSGVDYMPTCLDLAGCPEEPSAEGDSFAALATDPAAPPMNRAIYAEMQPWCMIREGAYKLVADKDPFTATHLFNLDEDPYELTNLLETEAVAIVKQDLLAKLEAWYARVSA